MKTIITRKQELATTIWPGGTTTQLTIYPPGSTLQERNFIFRISTARVEAETSTFTRLPGIRRVIMILEGQLELKHIDHYTRLLKKSETDTFSGDWETRSSGKVVDFNLMTTGKASGTVEMINISHNHPVTYSIKEKGNTLGIYVLKGEMKIQNSKKDELLGPGDFLLVFPEHQVEFLTLQAKQESEYVKVAIDLGAI